MQQDESLMLVLCKDFGNRLAVDLESFLQFNSEIDYGLNALEQRWADFSTAESLRAAGEPIRSDWV